MFKLFFIVGAFYSLLSLKLLIVLPIRRLCRLQNAIVEKHLNLAGWMLLVSGIVVGGGYALEIWFAWYGHSRTEWDPTIQRMWDSWVGRSYCLLIVTNSLMPMLLLFRRVRCNDILLFLIALMIQCGIWIERIAIVQSRS